MQFDLKILQMKIGVFLTKRKPQEGGGYTITEELLNSLVNLINFKKNLTIVFFLVSNDYDGKVSSFSQKK